MRLEAYVVHHISGRLRIRIPGAKNKPSLLENIRASTRQLPDVVDVESNPLTGSLLILYTPDADKAFAEMLSESLNSAVPFSLRPPKTPNDDPKVRGEKYQPSHVAKAVMDAANDLDREIRYLSDDQLDLRVLLPLAATGVGILALRTSTVTPLWLTLLIFAFHSFLSLHSGAEEELALAEEAETPGNSPD